VEKVIYAVQDVKLPFAVTFAQMGWFVVSLLLVIVFADVPPLSLIEGAFLKYGGIPVGITLFMSKKTFDGKKPYKFLISAISYVFRPKATYAGKPIKLKKGTIDKEITYVRRERHGISS